MQREGYYAFVVHHSSFHFVGATHVVCLQHLNNLLKKVFRRWHLPEELPDSPLHMEQATLRNSKQGQLDRKDELTQGGNSK